MSSEDAKAGREIVDRADQALREGAKVFLQTRSRGETFAATRVTAGPSTVRIVTESGTSYDLAYSAIEAARYVWGENRRVGA
ncbi:hypothetical protein [Sphingomonas sp.]|uniref:hypothetical protein n=1 Tax=Sphingomonas sp. TaxID=28214 RepID=UPI002FDA600A